MRFLVIFSVTLTAAFSLPQSGFAGGQNASTSVSADAQGSAQMNAIADRYMTAVQTQLNGKVDTKNAVAGQEVTAKTVQAAKLADGTMLPKGTKLVGHIVMVQARSKDQENSMLAMTFDRAELKDGQSVALRTAIRTIGPPASVAASDGAFMDQSVQAGPMGSAPAGGGPVSARGGGGGGMVGAPVRGVGQTAGSTVGAATADSRAVAGSAVGSAGPLVAAGGETVSEVPRATALPGVMLSNSSSANVSGVLTAGGRNVTLDAGTQITMGVIAR
jgi:hypothetical protein